MMMLGPVGLTLGTAAIGAVGSAFVVVSQKWHGKHTLDHDLEGAQKFHTIAVPRIGGVAVVGAIVLALLICELLGQPVLLPAAHTHTAVLLLCAALPTFLAGSVEDVTKRVSVRTRLVASIASALAASWLLNATVDALDIWGVDALLAFTPVALAVTALVVAGGVNAVNIIDGFNGLAATVVVLMLAALGAVAWQVNDMLVAELALLGMGATLGFLAVNYPTGRLFLGDGGAYFLGFWVAEIAVLLLVRNDAVNAWQVLAICGYPVIEVMYSMYRRKIVRRASPGAPDALHLHTLVFRRVVSRFLRRDEARPWMRNAAVVCVTAPVVGIGIAMGVVFGDTVIGGIAVVCGQVLAYLAVYARLVRGSWSPRSLMRDEAAVAQAP